MLVRGLEKSYGDLRALDGVDLEIHRGEVFGLLGPNGAGKTTTVEILEGYRSRDRGEVTVLGLDPGRQRNQLKPRMGIVLQSTGIEPYLTVAETVTLYARLYPHPRPVDEVIELVELTSKRNQRVKRLSGGQQRRLEMAIALAGDPEILFLDEPTTGLDPASRTTVWEEVSRLNRELGMTIFLTTQYLEEADVLAHRVGIINRGRLVAEGTPQSLKRSIADDVIVAEVAGDDTGVLADLGRLTGVRSVTKEGDEITLRVSDGPALLSPVALGLAGTALEVLSITLRTPTLDDVFLELTGNRIEAAG